MCKGYDIKLTFTYSCDDPSLLPGHFARECPNGPSGSGGGYGGGFGGRSGGGSMAGAEVMEVVPDMVLAVAAALMEGAEATSPAVLTEAEVVTKDASAPGG
eukprot:SM000029S10485  [mRNA]  locus=s29:308327:308900:- [translate_table: standard]